MIDDDDSVSTEEEKEELEVFASSLQQEQKEQEQEQPPSCPLDEEYVAPSSLLSAPKHLYQLSTLGQSQLWWDSFEDELDFQDFQMGGEQRTPRALEGGRRGSGWHFRDLFYVWFLISCL